MKILAFVLILGDMFALGYYASLLSHKEDVPRFSFWCAVLGIILLTPSMF